MLYGGHLKVWEMSPMQCLWLGMPGHSVRTWIWNQEVGIFWNEEFLRGIFSEFCPDLSLVHLLLLLQMSGSVTVTLP